VSDPLRELLEGVASGRWPQWGAAVQVLSPSPPDLVGVLAFSGCSIVAADVDPAWVARLCSADDLSAPLCPPFLMALSARVQRAVNNIDIICVAEPASVPTGAPELTEREPSEHPRVLRSLGYRSDVHMWTTPGAILVLGRGVARRWEVAVEVAESARGRGLGRLLAAAARGLVPPGEPLWAQIAPGNAASVRAFLAAGFRPVGAEALLH